jgi:hypothetical protein
VPAAQHLEGVPKVARRLGPELEPCPRRGVDKTEQRRVQRQPSGWNRVGGGIAVDRVPQHRVAQVGEVDPHLVRAPGSELRLHQRHPSEPLKRAHHGVGRPPPRSRRQSRPAGARARAADAASYQDFAGHIPAHERDVTALHGVGAELGLKVVGRGVGESEHHHTRGVAVETVYDQHPPVAAAPPLKLGRGAGEHRVLVPLGRRVNEKPGGFVDDHNVRVRVDDLDRGRLGRACTPREVGVVLDRVAGPHLRTGVGDHHAVDQHVTEEHLALRAGVGRGQDDLGRAPEPERAWLHRTSVSPEERSMWTASCLPG